MRTKPRKLITDARQAEEALARIDAIDRRFAEWDIAEAEGVMKVREVFINIRKDNNYAGMEAERKLLVKELEAFAEQDAANWKAKTFKTPHGSIGFRTAQPSVALVKKVASSFKRALEILNVRLPEFVRQTPEVDKEKILAADRDETLDAKALRECGLEVKKGDDEFWLESSAAKDLDIAAKKLKAA